MLLFVCILGLFSATSAAVVPKPCCAKHQMTAELVQITGSYTNGTPATVEVSILHHCNKCARSQFKLLRKDVWSPKYIETGLTYDYCRFQ